MTEGLRQGLRASDAYEIYRAIAATETAGPAAATLIPELAALLTNDQHVPDTQSGHLVLCELAAYAIRRIGVPPDVETLRTLLADPRVMEFPVACFDQGMYIGDYAAEEVATAGLAAMLVPLAGKAGVALLPDLERNAGHANDKIATPAAHAIEALRRLP